MIDLYKLRIFNTVAQAASFSAAAEQLFMTQSAVSQHIKDLESSLGQQLFQRGWRGVTLTPQGEVLAEYSRRIFSLVAKAETALTNVEHIESGRVSVGATPGASVYLLPDWVQRFRARYPRLTVTLNTGLTNQIVADILAQRLDIGVIEGELNNGQPHLGTLVLEEVEQMVVVGFKHPFWDREALAFEELDQQSFIVRQPSSQSRIWLDSMLEKHNITPTIGAEFDNLESMKRAVAHGMCLAVLPAYVVKDEVAQHQLRTVPIQQKPLTRTLKLVWNLRTDFSPVTRAFLAQQQEHYPVLAQLDAN